MLRHQNPIAHNRGGIAEIVSRYRAIRGHFVLTWRTPGNSYLTQWKNELFFFTDQKSWPGPSAEICRGFCSTNFGGFCRRFSWRIFLGTFCHKNEEKNPATKSTKKSVLPKPTLKNHAGNAFAANGINSPQNFPHVNHMFIRHFLKTGNILACHVHIWYCKVSPS